MKTVRTTTPLAVASALVMLAGPTSLAAGEAALWSALAEGGKAVMIRHTQSEEAAPEVSMHLSPEGECAEEQGLSEEGREQARALGERFEEHGVTVDVAISSQFCRARQTAELAFGDYEAWTPLNLIESLPTGESEWLMEDVRERIGDFDGDGVLVLISHRSNINTITFQQADPGDMVVMKPEGFGGFDVLGMIARE